MIYKAKLDDFWCHSVPCAPYFIHLALCTAPTLGIKLDLGTNKLVQSIKVLNKANQSKQTKGLSSLKQPK